MSSVELTDFQRQITRVLTNKYQQTAEPVGSQTLADALDRARGTVRNNMQQLKRVGLVEGVPGPGGGYRPTQIAFEKLGREHLDETATVSLAKDFTRLRVTVDDITFPNVLHPETCTAHVSFQQSVDEVDIGDPVIVGPTPLSDLVIAGEVRSINETADLLLLDIGHLEAPLEPSQ